MTRIASRYAGARDEAHEGSEIAKRVAAIPMNFGDADDPDALARRLLDMAARLDAAAGHYRAAAAKVRSVSNSVQERAENNRRLRNATWVQLPDTYSTGEGWR